jgi:energy-converting hydrogenase Eha subunit A
MGLYISLIIFGILQLVCLHLLKIKNKREVLYAYVYMVIIPIVMILIGVTFIIIQHGVISYVVI